MSRMQAPEVIMTSETRSIPRWVLWAMGFALACLAAISDPGPRHAASSAADSAPVTRALR